ncbi:MAG: hypothetical protein QXU32_00045 [Nitrososphaerales archaeon]
MGFLALIIFPFLTSFGLVGQEIAITIESGVLPIVDGIGSFETEWKQSSEYVKTYEDGTKLALRAVHDRDNVYLLLDTVTDSKINKNGDFGTVCFDIMNNGGHMPQNDDYCFLVAQGSKTFVTYQGGSNFGINNFLNKIPNPEGIEAHAGISNEFNRYSSIPHAIYEFKIPTEVITRSNTYGFYFAVYDADTRTVYSMSEKFQRYPYVPSPDQWGRLVSPDNSLPEFHAIQLILILSSVLLIVSSTRIVKMH